MENVIRKIKHPFYVLLAVSIFCFSALGQARTSIRVNSDSVVNNEQMVLGQIARISADPVRDQRLRNIALGYAPSVGSTRELARPQILLAIKAAGFDDGEFSLETPATMIVRRASQNISSAEIREAVEKAIKARFNDSTVVTEILRVDVPADIAVPVGSVDMRVSIAGVRSLFEKFPVQIEIRIDGKIIRTFSATAEVAAYAEVLVAANDLIVDKKIAAEDVKLQRIRLEKPVTSYLRDPSALKGVQMIKPLETGKPLTSDFFAAAVVIKLGDTVRIEGQSGRMQITVIGEARANGRIGDRISVRNKQSNFVLQAIVVDEGVVRVVL